MSNEKVAIPPTTYHVHEREDDGSLGAYIGGCNDLPSAIVIASTLYSAVQRAYEETARVFVVVDDAGVAIAFIGRHPDQPVLP